MGRAGLCRVEDVYKRQGTIFVIGQAAGMFKSNPKVTDEKGKAQVTVPDILGMTVEEATETLNKKGLGLSIAERAYSDKYEKGEIMEQKTAANKKVDKNTEIQVVVSNGEEILTVAVPDVSGQSESAAQKTLEDANLVVDSESKYDDHIEAGKVISTDPAAGMEVEEGTHVKMYVSMGVEKVEVPQITGITSEEAQAALAAVGLIGGSVTEEYSEEYDAGYVISQGKSAGSKLEKGSAVDYVVSKGSSKVEVPDLYGMTMAEAQQLSLIHIYHVSACCRMRDRHNHHRHNRSDHNHRHNHCRHNHCRSHRRSHHRHNHPDHNSDPAPAAVRPPTLQR